MVGKLRTLFKDKILKDYQLEFTLAIFFQMNQIAILKRRLLLLAIHTPKLCNILFVTSTLLILHLVPSKNNLFLFSLIHSEQYLQPELEFKSLLSCPNTKSKQMKVSYHFNRRPQNKGII